MKIFRAADAFCASRREGPYRFIQNRSRTSVVAPKNGAAAEKSKDQLSRDFWGCSIFDFCNNIGTKRTYRAGLRCPFIGGKAEVTGDIVKPTRMTHSDVPSQAHSTRFLVSTRTHREVLALMDRAEEKAGPEDVG